MRAVSVGLVRRKNLLSLAFRVDCPPGSLALPEPQEAARTDGLWQHTCFEAFVRRGDNGYAEFNLAPSGQWAAYDFDSYRGGMRNREVLAPKIAVESGPFEVVLTADLDVADLSGALVLSAVIEETDGTKSYWALAHAPRRPDFHHAACFAATLPAPNEA